MDIRDQMVQRAVRDIERRAERVADVTKLHDIYVDRGILSELDESTNQLIHGRRGVGKTHLYYFFRDHLATQDPSLLFQMHDCQRLGSGLASETSNPLTVATQMFNQLLNDIATQAFDDLPRIEARDAQRSAVATATNATSAILAFQDTISKGGDNDARFDFRNLGDTLDHYRDACQAPRLVLALDEWVAIPREAQPYFAEFLKRAFFGKPRISFKIAAVTYQAKMSAELGSGVIGFEPGADLFRDITLDNYFVWEEDRPGVELFFAQVLYNHLAGDLGWNLHAPPDRKLQTVLQTFFTQEKTFQELCRAAEGNSRDFLNVFRLAYFFFLRQDGAQRIGQAQVDRAAEDWYRQDKVRGIAGEGRLEEFLSHLIQSVIRGRRTKTFMVNYLDINHPLLSRLFTARLLHPLRLTWSHPDRPGETYHLVTMDYGCYRALRNTKSAPDEHTFYWADDPATAGLDDLVPLDDRRSIRRVVLTREELDKFAVPIN